MDAQSVGVGEAGDAFTPGRVSRRCHLAGTAAPQLNRGPVHIGDPEAQLELRTRWQPVSVKPLHGFPRGKPNPERLQTEIDVLRLAFGRARHTRE